MTIEELRAALDAAITRMHETSAAADAAEGDAIEARQAEFDAALADVEARTAEVERREAIERARANHPAPEPVAVGGGGGGEARVTRDEPIYRPDNGGFFRDLMAARGGNSEAFARLQRNNAEYIDWAQGELRAHPTSRAVQQRAGLTQAAGAGGEFIAPVWLIAQTAPYLRAGRAFADQCSGSPLPEYTNSINVPKISGGATVAAQTDAAGVSNTDLTTTSVTAQVQTLAGRTVAAYQDVDLGGPIIEQLLFQDLLSAYWAQLDTLLINGTVTNAKGVLNVSSINTVTYTDASPTGPELWPTFFQAASQIQKLAFVGVDFFLAHPSTWNWFLASLDSQNRPLALAQTGSAFNQMALFNSEAQGIGGNINNIPVVVDANVPVNLGGGTNQAPIVACNRQTLVTYEGVPRFKVADQTSIANLQYQFVMWGYYAAAFPRQPKMISTINGTGMIVQAGY